MAPAGPLFAVTEPTDAFYSPGSAEESGYRSRNASHSSSNSVDGSGGCSDTCVLRDRPIVHSSIVCCNHSFPILLKRAAH